MVFLCAVICPSFLCEKDLWGISQWADGDIFFLQPSYCNQYLPRNDESKPKLCLLPVNGRINTVDWKQETNHSSLCWMANSVLAFSQLLLLLMMTEKSFLESISNPSFCVQMHSEREANMRPQLVVLGKSFSVSSNCMIFLDLLSFVLPCSVASMSCSVVCKSSVAEH